MDFKDVIDSNYKVSFKLILFLFLVIFLLGLYYYELTTIIGVVISVLTSLVAAFIFNRMTEKYEDKKLHELRNITNKEFLIKLLNSLKRFNNITADSWSAHIKLSKVSSDFEDVVRENFYKCTINYSYKKNLKTDKIKMIFYRIKTASDKDKIPQHLDLANEYEFYWIMDECGFSTNNDERLYIIDNLIVNNRSITLNKQVNDNEIVYNANITSAVPNNNMEFFSISYNAVFFVEKEDIIKISLDIPTNSVQVDFDFSDVDDEINVYGMDSISFTDNPAMYQTDSIWRFVYSDWLMPKNSFVFSWWKKHE